MARLIYPEFRVHLTIETEIYHEFRTVFEWLMVNNNLKLNQITEPNVQLCKAMLWRMQPCFEQGVTHVLCRDADALISYREAQRVQQWLESGKGVHCIHDNAAHSGLMGGMVSFDCAKLKAATGWNTWEQMIGEVDLSQRGSDQHLLNQRILPHISSEMHIHGSTETFPRLPNVDAKYWESNLCSFFIGSAGVNEMETIRFFLRLDEYDWQTSEIMAQYPKLFYWK